MPYWQASPVGEQPQITLRCWRVFDVDLHKTDSRLTRHFVGLSQQSRHERVSSPVQKFDPVSRCGVTRSGRIYRLEGIPGFAADAIYTWTEWKKLNRITVEKDVTNRLLEAIFGSSFESIESDKVTVPTDFPRNPYPGAAAGAQPKLLARKVDDKYVVGLPEVELQQRYQYCRVLIARYAEYGNQLRSVHPDYSVRRIIEAVTAYAGADTRGLSDSELNWIMSGVLAQLIDIRR